MILRVARHTNNPQKILEFYTETLGLDDLGSFHDHDGYNGFFLGKKELNWHLEFTFNNEKPNHFFDDDDLLVFYPKTPKEFADIELKCKEIRILPQNPYWKDKGFMIEDPDGFKIMISNQAFSET